MLTKSYGRPKSINKTFLRVGGPFPPPWDDCKKGEIVLVLQKKDNKIWLLRKRHYPPKVYRLPTGGIEINEDINTALFRELKEETGLDIPPTEFLGIIYYEFITKARQKAYFSSYIFRYFPINKDLKPTDESERISDTIWVEPASLKRISETIKSQTNYKKPLPFGERSDWCKFRSAIHWEVYKLLS